MKGWVNWDGRFLPDFLYYTDAKAITRMQKRVHADGKAGEVLELDLEHPSEELQKPVLAALSNPVNHGDYTLKAMLGNPDKFSVRKQLLEQVIEGFFTVCLFYLIAC